MRGPGILVFQDPHGRMCAPVGPGNGRLQGESPAQANLQILPGVGQKREHGALNRPPDAQVLHGPDGQVTAEEEPQHGHQQAQARHRERGKAGGHQERGENEGNNACQIPGHGPEGVQGSGRDPEPYALQPQLRLRELRPCDSQLDSEHLGAVEPQVVEAVADHAVLGVPGSSFV